MSMPSPSDAPPVLPDLISQHQTDVVIHATQNVDSSDEENGSHCSLSASFYGQGGFEPINSMKRFTPKEFTAV